MARALTTQDAHALMNELVHEATGQSAISVVDTSSFVSAGETVLSTGFENTLNALSLVIGRTLVASRPYNAKLKIINAENTGAYSHRMRKISFYSRDAKESGYFNTDLYTNFADGYSNGTNPVGGVDQSTKSMWEQNQPIPLEVNFAGSSTWQVSNTIYQDKLEQAFRSEDDFNRFIAGILTELANDIESQKEAFNRMQIINYIGALYDGNVPRTLVNLTYEFNQHYGTSYTSQQLRTTYATEFLEFFVARFKIDSDYMSERSDIFHWAPTVAGHALLRHTPKDKQRTILFNPLFTEAKTKVFPEIFNPEYLNIDTSYEGVNFWQAIDSPEQVQVEPAMMDIAGGSGQQVKGTAVNLDYVVGLLYDEDALMVDYQLERVLTSPIEARKGYYTVWYTFAKNAIQDQTENGILYYMADPVGP